MQSDDTVRIPLRARDGSVRAYALVDAADADWVNQWRWSLSSKGYVCRGTRTRAEGRQHVIRLHRELLGLPRVDDGRVGDHINRNKLDNRRSNLRILPKTGNPQNVPSYRGSYSPHRGVTFHDGKWRARVQVGRKSVFVGHFDTEDAAAEAAQRARAQYLPWSTD
jgi:hypothetical protein